MKVTKHDEVRTTHRVMVETDAIALRRSRRGYDCYRDIVAFGPVIRVTRLAASSARVLGFSGGEAYSIKEYGDPMVWRVDGCATVLCEGKSYTMRDFYNHIVSL